MESVNDLFKNNVQRRRKPLAVPAEMNMGKVQPQAIDLEEAVLGALMLEKDALTQVMDVLTPETFYKETHQMIYRSILELTNDNEPVDMLTVTQALKKKGELEIVGGAYYIAQLTSKVASASHVEYHAHIISEKYIQRQLIKISSETIRDAFEDGTDAFDLLDSTEQSLFELSNGSSKKNYETIQNLIVKARDEIAKASKNDTGLTGVPSAFSQLDLVTGGWQKSTLNIIAARPGHGKTAFALSLARNAAVEYSRPVAIFSLEMDALSLIMRLISAETEINSNDLSRGRLSQQQWKNLEQKIKSLLNAPIFIDDTPGISIAQFRAKARRLKKERNVELIIVDYLQLMTVSSDESRMVREQVISTISRSLKAISKELEIPIMALAQVSRDMEKRGGLKRPMLSDLRESGAIEQDADMVMFLYRPEKLGFDKLEDGSSTEGMAQVIIAKHRNGSLADVNLRFIDQLAKFVELDSMVEIDNGNYQESNQHQSKGIQPNVNFEASGSYTIQSKMNDDNDYNSGNDDDNYLRPNDQSNEQPF
jgi:replicative DNA helicase